MPPDNRHITIPYILAWSIAFALVVPASCWGLAQLLPAIGLAIGTLFGTAIAIAMHGLVAGGFVSTVLTPLTLVVVSTAGGLGCYILLVRTVQRAKADPFAWTLPVLALWAGAFTEISKPLDGGNELQNAIYTILAGAATLVGGMLFSEKNGLLRIGGLILTATPPVAFLLLVLIAHRQSKALAALSSVSYLAWAAFGIFVITSAAVIVLSQRASAKQK